MLVFETQPLTAALEVVGPVRAVLFASSSCVDTDFTAALSIVTADGRAAALCEGICRARFRRRVAPVPPTQGSPDTELLERTLYPDESEPPAEGEGGTSRPHLMEAGQVYELVIDMWETAVRIRPGERLRVDISSSNFPRFDRNLNTGGRVGFEAESVALVAENKVFCGADYPSRLLLPTLPLDSEQAKL